MYVCSGILRPSHRYIISNRSVFMIIQSYLLILVDIQRLFAIKYFPCSRAQTDPNI